MRISNVEPEKVIVAVTMITFVGLMAIFGVTCEHCEQEAAVRAGEATYNMWLQHEPVQKKLLVAAVVALVVSCFLSVGPIKENS